MSWEKTQGSVKPGKVDTTSSKIYNYVFRNVTEVKAKDELTGENIKLYEYETLKVHKSDWDLYLKAERNAANIDYVAMMSDIELPEEV